MQQFISNKNCILQEKFENTSNDNSEQIKAGRAAAYLRYYCRICKRMKRKMGPLSFLKSSTSGLI